jgi:hypothetical protein
MSNTMSLKELQAAYEASQAEAAALKDANEKLKAEKAAQANRKITLKVGAKGGGSLYGLGRYPVTLYKSQWLRMLDAADDIRVWVNANLADRDAD